MTQNAYAVPLASLDAQPADDRFYVVSTRKMLVLFFLTAGLFQLYWSFQNWVLHKRATGDSIWPLPRALFSIFFIHSLYRRIGAHDITGKRDGWDSGSYAAAMVFLLVAGYCMALAAHGSEFFALLAMLLIIPVGLVLSHVQAEVNARCGDPEGVTNDAFTIANYVWCMLGAVVWLLFLAGLVVPR